MAEHNGMNNSSEYRGDLLERATIPFDKPLYSGNLRLKLDELGKLLGCRTRYTEEVTYEFGCQPPLLSEDSEDPLQIPLGVKASGSFFGSVAWMGRNVVMMPFECYRHMGNDNFRTFDGLRFFITPGYELSEISRGEVAFMDATRDYFRTGKISGSVECFLKEGSVVIEGKE